MIRTTRYSDPELMRLLSGFIGYEDITPQDALKLAQSGEAVSKDPVGTAITAARTAAYAIPVPIPPLPIPIPAGAIIDAGEAVFNLGKKAVDWLEGGPQKRRRARKKKAAFTTAITVYTAARNADPVTWYTKPGFGKLRFATIMRDIQAGRRPVPEGGSAPGAKYNSIEKWQEKDNWKRLGQAYHKNPKYLKRDRQIKAELARKSGGEEEVKRQQLLQLHTALEAKKKKEADRQALLQLHSAIQKKKKKKNAKKKAARAKDAKKVVQAAKKKDRGTAKELLKKSKDLDKLRDKRTKATVAARKEAKRLRRKLETLKAQLDAQKGKPATAATRKKEQEIKDAAYEATQQEEFARQTNVVGNLLTKNAAAQAAIVKQMAAATASGNAVQAAALAKAYDRLAAAATGLRAIREAQLRNMKG